MLKSILFFLFSGSITLFSSEFSQLPQVIDFSRFKTSIHNFNYEHDPWLLGYCAFNYAPELTPVFALLKRDFHIDVAVETGTSQGSTTTLFSLLFDEVHTIEIVESVYYQTQKRLSGIDNVHCHLGSSEAVLKELLPSLKDKRILFYLDAHWQSYWPLLDELEEISKTHKDNCIIVIDDFKVPGRPEIAYDSYGNHACSHGYIKKNLQKVFTNYAIYYLIPKSPYCRAKFIAFPKDWSS